MEREITEMLRMHKPAKVAVYLGETLVRSIAVPNVRNKHARVLKCLADVDWDRLVMQNSKAEALAIYVVDGAANEDAGAEAATANDDSRVLQLLIKAQEAVMKFRAQETTDALNAVVKVMDTVVGQVVETVNVISQLHTVQLKAAQQMAQLGAGAGDSERPVSEDLLRMIAPQLVAKFMGGKDAGDVDIPDLVAKFQQYMAQQQAAKAAPAGAKPPNGKS